jgi:hypothetical protein
MLKEATVELPPATLEPRKMNRPRMSLLWAAFFACSSLVPYLSSAQTIANKKQIIRDARNAYYNLRSEGLAEFQCSVTPNWKALLADLSKSDPDEAGRALKTLNKLSFNARLGPDGKVVLTHNDLDAQDRQMADALRQIYSGMEQMISGFFDTWSLFMLYRPFPEVESQYQLKVLGLDYLLSYKDGPETDVTTTMGRDFAIRHVRVKTAEVDSSIQPKFTRTPKGLLFNSYEASTEAGAPVESAQLKVQIGYQEVEGLLLVQELTLSGTYGRSPFAMEVTFSDCTVTRRP